MRRSHSNISFGKARRGRKRSRIAAVFVVICITVLPVIYISDVHKIGANLDSYKGVAIYYNGIIYTQSQGKNYSDSGYYYGYKWQCVEYIKRFYYQTKGHEMPDVFGNAKDFFDPSVEHG